ncbi:putative TonB-dependent receptor [Sphingobium herbicidovorans NBRC 16415]|uniref:TonB-dependent receptor n=1 Tax=Sphingobium herbicidovorans (strain ATCC 700291 / DSM 11019 / CCUG 56400 / KCTC 2939 / LMG 18315 / NBRC 16415 / MH) TaxID=1219045 RepID=A0A086PBX8_SPHHM|nr:TonB-dependent receptor [Sphingobium herbicidovorans]KFG90896.1 putative TonB-dependent receptor [Sphingobium herbicidovorans NBRC 16415]
MGGIRLSTIARALMASTALVATPALAQSARTAEAISSADQTAGPGEAERQGGLSDIIVTARRRVENIQNVPVAATVVSQEQIENFGISSIEKVVSLAPQLIVGRSGSGNGASIGLRGISVNASSLSLEQSVAVVVDGVYYSGGRMLNLGLFDLQQVELLKGPQSLFYGKNTTAGALSFTTADPTPSLEGMVRVGYEFRGENPSIESFVSGPLSDTLSFRVAGRFSKQFKALIENVSIGGQHVTKDIVTGLATVHPYPAAVDDGERSATFRGTLKFQHENLSATLKATYNSYFSQTPNSSTVIGVCEQGFVQSDPTAPCGRVFKNVQGALPPDMAAIQELRADRNGGRTFLDFKAFNTTLNLEYELEDVSFNLVPAYTTWTTYLLGDSDYTERNLTRPIALGGSGGNIGGNLEKQNAFSIEARARTQFDGMINAMVGGYYQDSDLYLEQAFLNAGGPENSAAPRPEWRYLTVRKSSHTFGKTYSAFGQILVDITPELNIAGGVRYSHETKDQQLSQPYAHPAASGSFVEKTFTLTQKFDNTSPEATITYKPNRNLTIYASYRTGYKSGGYSISGAIGPTTTISDADFEPEKVSGFEGGIKSTLLDNQLRLNFSVYRYKYTGLQIDYFNPLTLRFLTLNAGSARTQGAELDLEYAPYSVPGLSLRGSAAYTDANYLQFPFAPCLSGQTPAEGCTLNPNPTTGAFTAQSLAGQEMPQAPKFTGTLGVDYEGPVGSNGMKFGISLNGRYSSRYKTYAFARDDAARFYQNGYAALDASIRLSGKDDRWELAILGKNLTNHFIQAAAFDLTGTGARAGLPTGVHADVRSSVYDPRTVTVQATVRF